MSTLAIIGSGISGMGCAHFLHRDFDITLFEQDSHVGGHAHTVLVREPGSNRSLPIDTGFMVYNRVTYPLLSELFDKLKVPVKRTDMSFSVRDHASGVEWCGSSLNHLFAQRRNIFNRRFLRMLRQVDRFNREACAALSDPAIDFQTLGEFVRDRDYGPDFLTLYLLPMSSAVWSTHPDVMLQFPAATLLRFFHNHGFLGLHTQHPWWTVDGGSQEYVRRLTRPWAHRIRRQEPVARVRRLAKGSIRLTTRRGEVHAFDCVIIATPAVSARRLLADPTPDETRLLEAFRYEANQAILHTDTRVLPRARRARASWNYEMVRDRDGTLSPSTHYWMNRLQGVSDRESYFVTINRPERIAPERIIRQLRYSHPRLDLRAIAAQRELPDLNRRARGTTETYFAGSYFGHGFHEDGLRSAFEVSRELLQRDPLASESLTVTPSATVFA